MILGLKFKRRSCIAGAGQLDKETGSRKLRLFSIEVGGKGNETCKGKEWRFTNNTDSLVIERHEFFSQGAGAWPLLGGRGVGHRL